MQRLFVMFPTGGPGIALLLLRVALAAGLVTTSPGGPAGWTLTWIAAALAVAFALGVATPLVALACLAMDLYRMSAAAGVATAPCALHAVNAVALALLGPGAYSLDSYFLGRRRVV